MKERTGLIAALVSSTLGGMTAAVTRYVIADTDAVTLAFFRFGIGFALILPLALALGARWPRGRDWAGVATLGLLFFGFFFVLYNAALGYTSAARGSLALSMLPLVTMLVAAAFGKEALTPQKSVGVLVAVGGVALALGTGLADAPAGAWRGDLLSLGVRARAHHADAGGQHHDNQPSGRLAPCRRPGRRAARPPPPGRDRARRRRHLARVALGPWHPTGGALPHRAALCEGE